MKWRKGITIGIISLVVPIVVLDVIGSHFLTRDEGWFFRWGVGLGATASLLLYVTLNRMVKK
jgi:hypothetical protein